MSAPFLSDIRSVSYSTRDERLKRGSLFRYQFLAGCRETCSEKGWFPNMAYVCSTEVLPFLRTLSLLCYMLQRFLTCPFDKVVCLHCAEHTAKIIICQLKPAFANGKMCHSNTSHWWKRPLSNSAFQLLLETRKTLNNLRTPMPRCNLIIYGSVVSFLV